MVEFKDNRFTVTYSPCHSREYENTDRLIELIAHWSIIRKEPMTYELKEDGSLVIKSKNDGTMHQVQKD